MTTNLLQLAERCEKAEGPDRELDAGIALAIGWRDCIPCAFNGVKHRMGGILNAPTFTASIDSAMTLVDDQLVTLVLREALDRLDQSFSPMDNYLSKLRLFACAAALRAHAVPAPETPLP